ncbi:PLP-dependent aminotransferase family protein [Roseibium algae]|uniref:PLP-dependent aminotransferase family protein n=1 Tax=Roseibium algae TaxID=3123038 RepID=A0ABU8TMS4_9HYPH
MTNWIATLPSGKGPMYLRLAEQIANDITVGRLPPGAKLPPQRDLAYDLSITVGTVGRAYALVRERGLVSGEVGRGTYVLGSTNAQAQSQHDVVTHTPAHHRQTNSPRTPLPKDDPDFGGTRTFLPPPDMVRMDSTSAIEVGQATLVRELLDSITREHPYEIASYTRDQPQSWRKAGKQWLTQANWSPELESIVPTLGAHSAIMAVIAATTRPGDRIVFEELTYSSISRAVALAGRVPAPAARDEHGPLPEDLDRLCSQTHPKGIFLMPTMHNPTLSIMSEERRHAIIDIARQHNLWIIEDEVYGTLRAHSLPALASMAPERTFHVGSLSKAVAAGVRGGWISCPPAQTQRVMTAHKMLSGGISFLLAELSARLVLSGAADDIKSRVLTDMKARHAIAESYLKDYDFNSAPDAPFLWLKLPEPWLPGTFKAASAAEKILIDDEDEFKTGRSERTHHRVRMGFTNPVTHEDTANAFATLKQLLDGSSCAYDSFE